MVVLKINSDQLRQFYGEGRYIVQIWKNKKRLFKHVYEYDIEKIYLNKTELAYILNMPPKKQVATDLGLNATGESMEVQKKPFDNHLNFIYVVQPFTQNFARIKYPFEDDYFASLGNNDRAGNLTLNETVLFINDEFLVIAENNNLKYAKTEEFLSRGNRRGGANDSVPSANSSDNAFS